MRVWIICFCTILFSPPLFAGDADATSPAATAIATPPFFKELARMNVSNAKGGTLTADGRAAGATLTIPPGALTNDNEEVVFSCSLKLPGLPEKPGDGMAFVQNSLVFAVQTASGKLKKSITLSLPYYNEQEITAAGTRVVMFNYWMVDKSTFEVLEAKPIPGHISVAKIETAKIWPEAEYVSLRLTQSPTLTKKSRAPQGFKLVPNSDKCLKIDGPKLVSPAGSREQVFEASFSNKCDYPIQASGCENKAGSKGCPLPKAVVMPAHSENMLTLSAISIKDPANIGACRVSLADGTPVIYDVVLSSAPKSATICLIKSTEN